MDQHRGVRANCSRHPEAVDEQEKELRQQERDRKTQGAF